MTAKLKKVFEVLGVQPCEEFCIKEFPAERFRITESLYIEKFHKDFNMWLVTKEVTYRDFLFDRLKIDKPTGTERRDQIAIDYARAFGCKYIAADKDGTYWAYDEKPTKKDDAWCNIGGQMWQLYIPVSFISWEDAEPYYIGG